MEKLSQKNCVTYAEGTAALSMLQCQTYLKETPQWNIIDDGKSLQRRFQFKNYYETIAFVNAVAWVAHQQDHHPDLEVHYNYCVIRYNTHTVGGLSENDFICAARVDALLD